MAHRSLRQAIDGLPDAALVPVGWIRSLLEQGPADDRHLTDLTVGEVAEALGRGESTVRGWLGSGALRGYKLRGHEWRVTRTAVREFQNREAEGETRVNGTASLGDWREHVGK